MGKISNAAATPETTRKKKGRPSKNRPPPSTPLKPPASNPTSRRSTRRNPNHPNSPPPQPEFDGGDDDDERKEKKVKLVVRLPQSDEGVRAEGKRQQHCRELDSGSGSGSGSESEMGLEDREVCAKKRKVDGADNGSDDRGSDQEKEVVKEIDNYVQGSPLESGPGTPLPEKKLLIFILDRLQKKDTYGVFSEPVDPNELPDYFDIIEQPMDFGTVRKKLDSGAYKNLEELETDVLLICSNAMQYNSADTVYYRQARTIQDLAKRDFDNLRHEGEPKVIRRGRPPNSKNQKKAVETSPADRVATELSSGATLAKVEDKANGSSSYNLRKGPALFRLRSADPYVSSYGSRNGENHSEWSIDWNNEFPASILRADMKYGKKHFTVDENKRDTYRRSLLLSSGHNPLVLANSSGNMKRLVPVGLHEALAYSRSLARYAANLGPVAWKIASRKIEAVLPAGVQYGPGWVGEKEEVPSRTSSFSVDNNNKSFIANSISGKPNGPSWGPQIPPQQNFKVNGFNGNPIPQGSGKVKSELGCDLSSSHSMLVNNVVREQAKLVGVRSNSLPPGYHMDEQGKPSSHEIVQQRHDSNNINNTINSKVSGAPPDLNVRVPAGSPSSGSLQIGSPQQPDLALQL
ncbi:DNA-binding bromodomain-containing protein [Striga hermonthica]|uniref:DNA-binding bromodomain-containing protein n=1 Tax=Striga hermonthica TaxID=68872 RepID=A0A9N7NZ18_STRHE|nr:DNA-binding bromodomain-containing protein [Striga hermonthica]